MFSKTGIRFFIVGFLILTGKSVVSQCPPSANIYDIIYSRDIEILEPFIPLLENCTGLEDSLALACHMLGVYFYNDADNYEKAIEYTSRALKIRSGMQPIDTLNLAKSCYNLGTFYLAIDANAKAESYLLQAESLFNGIAPIRQYRAQHKLGDVYWGKGDFKQSLNYLQLAAAGARALGDDGLLANCYLSFGLSLNSLKENQAAIDSLKLAVDLYNQIGDEEENIASAYLNMAYGFNELGQMDKAIDYFQKSLELDLKSNKSALASRNYNNLGESYLKIGAPEKALEVLNKGINIAASDQDALRLAGLHNNLAEVYFSKSDFTQALVHFQKAVAFSIPGFDETKSNAGIELGKLAAAPEKKKLHIYLGDLARCHNKLYEQSGDTQQLRQALTYYRLCGILVQFMREDFTRDAKLFWLDETYSTFEYAIRTAHQFYQETGDPQLLQDAFSFMEQNKAVLLLESLDKKQLYASVPDSLIQLRSILVEELGVVQRNLLDAADQADLSALELRFSRLQTELGKLEDDIKKSIPAYARFSNTRVSTLQEVQSGLRNGAALIEYFWGAEHLFVFVISSKSTKLIEISPDGLEGKIQNLLAIISSSSTLKGDDNYKPFFDVAQDLYEALLGQALKAIPDKIDELIIIPDGFLSYIPFEVLLSEKIPAGKTYLPPAEIPYLIQDYAVTYGYSASTILGSESVSDSGSGNLNFLGIAPLFSGHADSQTRNCELGELSELTFNSLEVEGINEFFPGQLILNEDATKERFLTLAKDFQILHFATHSCADYDSGPGNRIFFYDDYLYPHELQGLDLNASMIVLSACNTGVGQFKKGEGAMSMARAFAYTGVPSITMSLWSVNDKATADLMQLFYKNLEKGLSKSVALQQAKLEFLHTREGIRSLHPSYWAAFVHIGDVSPINSPRSFFGKNKWFFLLGAGVLIMGLFWFKKKTTINSTL
ncbi:MAG: CHAT domain-containing protein [Saprospiraceae bacterium]|nr:CHAT domain-containing protein [Saprospiraceae bacterium]